MPIDIQADFIVLRVFTCCILLNYVKHRLL